MYISHTWGLPLVTAMQDVQTEFDSMSHDLICNAMLGRGATQNPAGLHMRELTGMRAQINLPNDDTTEFFNFTKGGKQGGIETLDQWRMLVDHLLEPVVQKWCALGLGVKLVDDDGENDIIINRTIWTDNAVQTLR